MWKIRIIHQNSVQHLVDNRINSFDKHQMNMIPKMILSIPMNSFVQGSTHWIFSCCSSETIIPWRLESPYLRGAQTTGIVASANINCSKVCWFKWYWLSLTKSISHFQPLIFFHLCCLFNQQFFFTYSIFTLPYFLLQSSHRWQQNPKHRLQSIIHIVEWNYWTTCLIFNKPNHIEQ